jgi:arylsulfatase A-like enzyme
LFAAVVNVGVFGVLGGFLTYPLLQMVGSVRMVRSSVGAHLTPPVVAALVGAPAVYLAAVWRSGRPPRGTPTDSAIHAPISPRWAAVLGAAVVAWMVAGHFTYGARWATRQERRIAQNPHWVFAASWWQRDARHSVRLSDHFADGDLADFEPIGLREAPRIDVRRASLRGRAPKPPVRRPPNIILIVLESVAARWTSLSGGGYDTTPTLRAEASRGIVFDNFYAHIGRSSNSLSAMLLSAYPKLGFRDMTAEYPDLPGTSIASVLRERGYHTGFITPSALTWAGWDRFLDRRGFDDVRDERQLACGERISSWGVEDRCMVDDMVRWMEADAARPFFLMTWTQQTHHPYEPSPGIPLLPLARDRVIDDFGFDRYLNVLHETDHQIGRVFDAVRRAGRERDTLVVVTGDHGQAFGYPHESFMQGRTIYEEDVRVPLMIWFPRAYRVPMRSAVVGSHVDLAPTIVDLAGVPPAPEWQGRSLFDTRRSPRAYFYVAEDEFMLGVREDGWKYILNVRDGTEELFDLRTDETEQKNLARLHPDICARLRRRLAAWTEANRRQYLQARPAGAAHLMLRARGA